MIPTSTLSRSEQTVGSSFLLPSSNPQVGFSLVELMIVVAIIGILASIAVPKFQNLMAKAKQAEAKTMLSQAYALQMSYRGENDCYFPCNDWSEWNNLRGMGFSITGKARYDYISYGEVGWFQVFARSKNDTIISASCKKYEEWRIDDQRVLFLNLPANFVDCSQE